MTVAMRIDRAARAVTAAEWTPAPVGRQVRHLDLWEMLVWAYRDERVIEMTRAALFAIEAAAEMGARETRYAGGGSGAAAIESYGLLGTRIDGGGLRGVAPDCHPDAELLHDVVRTLGWLGSVIIRHARLGVAPEYPTASPRPHPTPADRAVSPYSGQAEHRGERIRYMVRASERCLDGNGRSVPVRYCPVIWDPSLADLREARFGYLSWLLAVSELDFRLKAQRVAFRHHRVTGFEAGSGPKGARRLEEARRIIDLTTIS